MDMNDRKQSEFSALNRLEEQISKIEADGGRRTRFGRSLWISGFLAIGLVGFTLSPAGAEVGNAIRADDTSVSCAIPADAPAMTTLGKAFDEDGDPVEGEAGVAVLEAVPTEPAQTLPAGADSAEAIPAGPAKVVPTEPAEPAEPAGELEQTEPAATVAVPTHDLDCSTVEPLDAEAVAQLQPSDGAAAIRIASAGGDAIEALPATGSTKALPAGDVSAAPVPAPDYPKTGPAPDYPETGPAPAPVPAPGS